MGGLWIPTGKSQVAIGFLRNTGMDPLEMQWALPVKLFLKGVQFALCEIC